MFKFIPTAVFLIHLLLAVQCAPLGRRQSLVSLSPDTCLDQCGGALDTSTSLLALDAAGSVGFASAVPGSEDDVNYLFERSGKAQNNRGRGSARYQPYTSRPHASGSGSGSHQQQTPRPPIPAHVKTINADRRADNQHHLQPHQIVRHWPHPNTKGTNPRPRLAYVTDKVIREKLWHANPQPNSHDQHKIDSFKQAGFTDIHHLLDHVEHAHRTGTPVAIHGTNNHDPTEKGARVIWKYNPPHGDTANVPVKKGQDSHLAIQTDHSGKVFGIHLSSETQANNQLAHMATPNSDGHTWGIDGRTGEPQRLP